MSSIEDITTAPRFTALILPAGKEIRTTADKRISLYDALEGSGYKNPRDVFQRLAQHYPEVVGKCDNFSFPGQGQRATPVVNQEGLLYIFSLLPRNKAAEKLRHSTLRIAMRFWEGDPAIAEHVIEQQNDPEVLKRLELRARTKQTNKRLNLAIKNHAGSKQGRENIYAAVAGRNNQAVFGRNAKEIKRAYGVRQTRDALDNTRLSLMATAEELEAVNIPRCHAWGNQQILTAIEEVCQDVETLRRKYGIGPLVLPSTGSHP